MTMTRKPFELERRDAVAAILRGRGDALVVSGLGSPTWDVAAAGDNALNFYLWGAMGGAAMVGLGLARAQRRRRVLVITGDGEMLMGLGSLATVAAERPANLSIVVLDNERYGETGLQASHTARGVDLAAVARAVGFPAAAVARSADELDAALPALHGAPGPVFTVVKVSASQPAARVPLRDGTHIKNRFREARLGAAAFARSTP
jgi:thiamine pyrophosphate-dependent acetolactate synthase large subunit-like protein